MKKVVSLALALVLACGMGAVVFAADYRPAAQVESLDYAYTADAVSAQTVSLGSVQPKDKLVREIPLVYGLFDATIPEGRAATDRLTTADLRTAGLDVRTKASRGAEAVKSASIDSQNGVIRVVFADTLSGTNGIDFDITVYLTVNTKRYDGMGLTFTGTLANEVNYVYGDDDYVDLSDGTIVEAAERVNKIEVYLGEGVSVFTSMNRGKKYQGTATRNPESADYGVFDEYVDVVDVLNLKTSGLNVSGDVVKLDTDYDFHVYDGDLNYLGRTSQMLPYSGKYYLSGKKLDVGGGTQSSAADSESPSDVDEPSGGGGDGGGQTSQPLYDKQPGGPGGINPDTGDSRFAGLAAVFAAVSLAVILLARKRKHK